MPCVRASTTGIIQHTEDCKFNDLRNVWLWTPGNLLMNAETSTCIQTDNKKGKFLPMSLTQCSSSDLQKKWRCEERRLLWGVSFDSFNITHAARYYKKDKKKAIIARSVKDKVNKANTWTVFPTNNRSVCSARDNEGNKLNHCSHNISSNISSGV